MESAENNAKATLSILNGRSRGAALEMAERRDYTIGRSSETDLQVRDLPVSRVHCKIEYDGDYFWLIDNDSANGTEVNNEPVRRYMLYDGDTITVGKTNILFRLFEDEEQNSSRQIVPDAG